MIGGRSDHTRQAVSTLGSCLHPLPRIEAVRLTESMLEYDVRTIEGKMVMPTMKRYSGCSARWWHGWVLESPIYTIRQSWNASSNGLGVGRRTPQYGIKARVRLNFRTKASEGQ